MRYKLHYYFSKTVNGQPITDNTQWSFDSIGVLPTVVSSFKKLDIISIFHTWKRLKKHCVSFQIIKSNKEGNKFIKHVWRKVITPLPQGCHFNARFKMIMISISRNSFLSREMGLTKSANWLRLHRISSKLKHAGGIYLQPPYILLYNP